MISISSTLVLMALTFSSAPTLLAAPTQLIQGEGIGARAGSDIVPVTGRDVEMPTHRIIRRRMRSNDGDTSNAGRSIVPDTLALAGHQTPRKETTIISSQLTTIEKDHGDGHPDSVDVIFSTASTTIVEHAHGKYRHSKHCPQRYPGSRDKPCTCKHLCLSGDKEDWKGWKATNNKHDSSKELPPTETSISSITLTPSPSMTSSDEPSPLPDFSETPSELKEDPGHLLPGTYTASAYLTQPKSMDRPTEPDPDTGYRVVGPPVDVLSKSNQ